MHPLNALCLVTLVTVVAASGSSGLAAETVAPQPVDGKIQWVYSYAEGKELGRKLDKPLFIVFRCER